MCADNAGAGQAGDPGDGTADGKSAQVRRGGYSVICTFHLSDERLPTLHPTNDKKKKRLQ